MGCKCRSGIGGLLHHMDNNYQLDIKLALDPMDSTMLLQDSRRNQIPLSLVDKHDKYCFYMRQDRLYRGHTNDLASKVHCLSSEGPAVDLER
jgi:hypothetical protein